MVAHIKTIAFRGIEAVPIDVQVHLAPGQNAFSVVGLPDKSIAESRDRVRAALGAIGLGLPYERITISLSPADLPKEGSHYDLPIALGLIVAMGGLGQSAVDGFMAMGELGLDGSCRAVPGALPAAVTAHGNGLGLICPASLGPEAAWSGLGLVEAPDIIAADNLIQILNHLRGTRLLQPPQTKIVKDDTDIPDMADIRGQEQARLSLEVAAAGGHNMLMSGPPGAGKSMLASRLPGLLPPLTAQERLDVSMIESLSASYDAKTMSGRRPFRAPHHSASVAALIGGGRWAKPGEISLAHNGVLFLDELPEFPRSVLDALRQPIETGQVMVARAAAHVTYPARFQLIAAMNPCRCGYADDAERACHRVPLCVQDYMNRLSGPILDRFDIRINVPPVSLQSMIAPEKGESTARIAERVAQARIIQLERQNVLNAQLDGDALFAHTKPDMQGQKLLDQVVAQDRLTARGFGRVLRVMRTLADLHHRATPTEQDVASALLWRGIAQN